MGVDPTEVETVVGIPVIVERDRIQAATPAVPFGLAPVDRREYARAGKGGLGEDPAGGKWPDEALDRWTAAAPFAILHAVHADAATDAIPPDRLERRAGIRLEHTQSVVDAVILIGVVTRAVEGHLRRVGPARFGLDIDPVAGQLREAQRHVRRLVGAG
jgi:hypothetical protein